MNSEYLITVNANTKFGNDVNIKQSNDLIAFTNEDRYMSKDIKNYNFACFVLV